MREGRVRPPRAIRVRENAGCPLGHESERTIKQNKSNLKDISANVRAARSIWGPLPHLVLKHLRELTKRHQLSVIAGDITLLGSQFYVTHRGLLRIGERNHCSGIVTRLQKNLSDPTTGRWVFRATVFKSLRSRGF